MKPIALIYRDILFLFCGGVQKDPLRETAVQAKLVGIGERGYRTRVPVPPPIRPTQNVNCEKCRLEWKRTARKVSGYSRGNYLLQRISYSRIYKTYDSTAPRLTRDCYDAGTAGGLHHVTKSRERDLRNQAHD